MKLNEIKVINKTVPYSKVTDYINFAVDNSYDENGVFHGYLKDYAIAVAVISMFTDYDGDMNFDEVMDLVVSDKWDKIKEEIGDYYYAFRIHVTDEIKYRNRPMAKMDGVLGAAYELLQKVNEYLGVIDIDKLKNYDFTAIQNAIEALSKARENEVKNNDIENTIADA